MNRILIVGCGDVALRAIPWLVHRFRVFALTRSVAKFSTLRDLGVIPVLGDLDDRKSLPRVAGIADVLLHFAPPQPAGDKDFRTRSLLWAMSSRGSLPQRIVYISTTGVYGDCNGEWVSETRRCCPRNPRAKRRVDAEQMLRRFAAARGVCLSILRVPGIYAADRLPLDRLRRGDPVLIPEDDVHTNHIHADDLARMACLCIFRGAPGRVYNAVDATDLKMGDYFDLAADWFDLPRPPRLSRDDIKRQLSPMTLSFMSESRRIDNARLQKELRYRLMYPTVREGFAAARI